MYEPPCSLRLKIEAGDNQSLHFYLRYKGGSRGYRTNIQHSGDAAAPIQAVTTFDFAGMPIEELRALHGMLSAARERTVLAAAHANEFGSE